MRAFCSRSRIDEVSRIGRSGAGVSLLSRNRVVVIEVARFIREVVLHIVEHDLPVHDPWALPSQPRRCDRNRREFSIGSDDPTADVLTKRPNRSERVHLYSDALELDCVPDVLPDRCIPFHPPRLPDQKRSGERRPRLDARCRVRPFPAVQASNEVMERRSLVRLVEGHDRFLMQHD